MTIKEWLTPDFFALNVILVALLMNLTIYGVVSNFTVDFKIGEKFQTGVYASATFAVLTYGVMVMLSFMGVISNYPYLYDNKYNFLLLGKGEIWGGNGPVFLSLILGIVIGTVVGTLAGRNRKVRIAFAVSALICEGLVAMFTVLWIVNQT